MSSLVRLAVVVAATVLPVSLATAQGGPNLTGTWVMAVDKSDFGPMPAPTSRTDVIDHKEPAITIKRTIVNTAPAPSATVDLKYGIDGKPYTNTTPQGDVVSTLKWEGKVLIITSKVSTPNGDADITDRLTLAADGKTMTQDRLIAVQGQEIRQTMVFVKQ